MPEPSGTINSETTTLSNLRPKLNLTRMDAPSVMPIFRDALPATTEEQAVNFLQPRVKHFGVADLFDSPHAQLAHKNGTWTVSNPIADLFLDDEDNLRFTGTCHQIQPAVYTTLIAISPGLQSLAPLREWVSFNADRNPDYYHYFVGSVPPNISGFRPSAQHDLDPSVFYTRLFAASQGASEHEFRGDLAGQVNYTPYLNGENPLSGNMVPYIEEIFHDSAKLISIGLVDADSKSQIRISLNVIDKTNRMAPDRTIEFAFDLSQPERILSSAIEKFVAFKGYRVGSDYNVKNGVGLNEIDETDRLLIERNRDRFVTQIRRLISLPSYIEK